MALYKRGNIWWICIVHDGKRIQKSTGTSEKLAARKYHDKVKADLWNATKIAEVPLISWEQAVVRWLREKKHKRSIKNDIENLRWLDKYFNGLFLHEITQKEIEKVALAKEEEGAKPATINRMLEIIRALLRCAYRDWNWLNSVPPVRMRPISNNRVRWLKPTEAKKLISELPPHLADMAAFTLATGLRAANVKELMWRDIDLVNGHAWVHPDKSKSKKAIPVPLNDSAIAILKKRVGNHPKYVFTYKGKPIRGHLSTNAWYKAKKRAGIVDFRWHDLRHTWASWHVQNGTSLQELQQLGGWSDHEMVLRYAHLSSEHLKKAANKITTILLQ